MRALTRYIAALLAIATTLSCVRQELEESSQFLAYVPVTIDWDESNLESTGVDRIANVSILFYPKDGSSPVTTISDNLTYNLVTLPIGEYSVLIYNDIYNNIRNITFDNTSSFDEISTRITEDYDTSPLYYTSDEPETLALDHGRVAWYHLEDFTVDKTMVEYTRSQDFGDYIVATKSIYSRGDGTITKSVMPTETSTLSTVDTKSVTKSLESLLDLKPQPKTSTVTIVIRVENLNNAVYNGAIYSFGATTRGFAHGSYFTKDDDFQLSDDKLIYYNAITDYTFDENGVDGYVSYSFNCFGRSPEDEYSISLQVIELSGELFEADIDITQLVVDAEDLSNIYIDLSSDSEKVTLPEYEEVGFNVKGWGDSETVYL